MNTQLSHWKLPSDIGNYSVLSKLCSCHSCYITSDWRKKTICLNLEPKKITQPWFMISRWANWCLLWKGFSLCLMCCVGVLAILLFNLCRCADNLITDINQTPLSQNAKIMFWRQICTSDMFWNWGIEETLCNVLQQCLEEKKHYVSRLLFIKDPIMILFSHLTFSSSHNICHNCLISLCLLLSLSANPAAAADSTLTSTQ